MASEAASKSTLAGQLMLVKCRPVLDRVRHHPAGADVRALRRLCALPTLPPGALRLLFRRARDGRSCPSPRVWVSFTLTRILLALIALAFLVNAGVGVYHSGVEWKWWPGPTSCSGGTAVEWVRGRPQPRARARQGGELQRSDVALPRPLLRRMERGGIGDPRRSRRLRRGPCVASGRTPSRCASLPGD